MSSAAPHLATQLQLIRHANPLLRRQAVFGCFQLLKSAPGISATAATSTIQECLAQPYLEVVQEAVTQLPQLAALQRQGLEAAVLVQLLLDILPSASTLTAPHLASGILQLLPYQYSNIPPQAAAAAAAAAAATAAAAGAGGDLPGWAQHPLSLALQCQPSVAPVLLSGSCKLLATAAAGAGSSRPRSQQQVQQLGLLGAWRLLQPFFSFLLLGYSCSSSGHRGSRSAHTGAAAAAGGRGASEDPSDATSAAAALVWHLVRLASSSEQVAALVTPFLVTHLVTRPRGTLHDRQLLVNTCVDLVDLLEAHQPEAGSSTGASSSTTAAAGSSRTVGADSSTPPGDWWAVSCRQIGQLLLQVAVQPCSGSSSSSSDSTASDTGSCLLQLQRLLVLQPGALPVSCCPALGCLLLALEGPQEQQQVLQLLAALMHPQQQQPPKGPQQQQVLSPWDAGLLVLPLLQCVALSTTPAVKAWASRVLAAAANCLQQQRQDQQQVAAEAAAASPQGAGVWGSCEEVCAIASAQQLLAALWTHPTSDATDDTSAVAWCCSLKWQLKYLQQQVKHSKAAAAGPFSVPLQSAKDVRASEAAGGGLVGAGSPLGLGGGVMAMAACWVLSALLTHPNHLVIRAAAAATQELLLVHPPAAVPCVPLLLWRLQGVTRQQGLDAARSAQALLGVLPALCYDPTVAAMVQRALTPLTAPATTQPLLSATSLQLTMSAWQVTGRGWSRAEAAINGCMKPGAAKDAAGWGRKGQADAQLPLRLMRAKALRDAAAGGSGRALDCVSCLQDCLTDPRPAVAALAMEAVSALTKEDTLDFYSVWQVVNTCLPPQKVLAAAAGSGSVNPVTADPGAVELAVHMVDLLGCAVLDARLYADRAAAILELLWSVAVQHGHPKVRAAALRSLAAFPLDLLEQMELLPPLQDYVQPLLKEAAAMDALLSSAAFPQQQQQLVGGMQAYSTLQQQQQQHQQLQVALADQQLAMEAAEQLSLLAVNQEFDQRRVFLAAAATGAAAGAAGSSSYAGAAAGEGSTRELLQVRHRLLRSLPLALTTLGAAERGGAAAAGDAAVPAVGPLLLLWQPKATSGAAAAEGGALWQAVFEDVAARAGGLSWVEPGVWAAAWQAFMTRWQLSTARPAEALLSQLRGLWQQGTPGEAVAACGAAAGLAAAGQLGEAQLSEVVKDMLGLVKRPRATPVAAAAAAALARLAAALHPSDWTSRRTILTALQQLLLTSTRPTAAGMADEDEEDEEGADGSSTLSSSRVALAAAAVEGLGHLGVGLVAQYVEEGYAGVGAPRMQLAGMAAEQLPEALQLSCAAFKLLLTCLEAAQPAGAGVLQQQLLPQLPVGLPVGLAGSSSSSFWTSDVQQDVGEGAQLHRRLWQSSLSMAHALGTVTQSPALVTPLVTLVTQQWHQAAANPAAAAKSPALLASIGALPQAAAVAAAQDVLQPSELTNMLTSVTSMVNTAAANCNYQVAAAAAAASGQLLAVALPHGSVDQSTVQQVVDQLISLAAGQVLSSSTGQESAAAVPAAVRLAAVAGLGAVTGVDPWGGTSGCQAGDAGETRGDTFSIAAGSLLPTTSFSSTSAAAPPHLPAAKAILRQLESLAAVARKGKAVTSSTSHTIDQRVKGAAAWMLAAVCHTLAAAAGGGPAAAAAAAAAAAGGASGHTRGGRGGADGAAVVPLSVYPAAGVLRPLAERLLAPSSCTTAAAGEEGTASLALGVSITRVLYQGQRLPAADWLPLCRRPLQPTTLTAAAGSSSGGGGNSQPQQLQLQLQQAVLQLVLAHCTTPALGLSGVLDWVLSPARFQQAHVSLQVVLLEQLLVVLRVLPVNRGPALLTGLAGMVQSAAAAAAAAAASEVSGGGLTAAAGVGGGAGSSVSGDGGRQVWVAVWKGVAALCQAAGAKEAPFKDNKSLVEAVHGAVLDLVNQLPVLPVLPPGFLLHLLQPAAHRPPTAGPQGNPFSHAAADGSVTATCDVLSVWAAGVDCLARLRPELLLKVTPLQPAPLLDTLQAAAAATASQGGGLATPATTSTAAAGGASGGGGVLQGAQDLASAFLRSCQVRGLLVARQALSWREVAEAWPLLLQLPVEWLHNKTPATLTSSSGNSSSLFVLSRQQWDALLPCIAAAACCLPQAAQVQLLQEFSASAAVCGSADAAILLLAALVAAWTSPPPGLQSSTPLALGDQPLTKCWGGITQGTAAALQALPANLVQLLNGPRWQGAAESVCQVLLQLQQVARRSSRHHQQQQRQQPGLPLDASDTLSAALVAVARTCMPGQVAAGGAWEEVSAQLCS